MGNRRKGVWTGRILSLDGIWGWMDYRGIAAAAAGAGSRPLGAAQAEAWRWFNRRVARALPVSKHCIW